MGAANGLIAALEGGAVTLLDEEKATIEAAADKATVGLVDSTVKIINDNLPTHGFAALIDGQLKSTLIAAKPEIEAALTAEEHHLLDLLEATLKAAGARAAGA